MQVYFPNINGLRFFAAAIVLLRHVEQFKQFLLQPSAEPIFGPTGNDAVLFFFTLSGFLITYLLLEEKRSTGTISVKNFYLRRCLRIWPLYYLVILAGLFLLPALSFFDVQPFTEMTNIHFERKAFLYICLLANAAFVIYPYFPYISHTWSIAVEEQFYLIWPWIIKKVKNLLPVLVAILLMFALLAKGLVGWIVLLFEKLSDTPLPENLLIATGYTDTFFSYFRIDCMAAGAIAAFVYQKAIMPGWMEQSFRKGWQMVLLILIAVIIVVAPRLHISDAFFGPLFAWVIVNFAVNKQCIFSLENPLLNYLGKISYGIYMFHPFAVILTIKLMLLTNGTVNGWLPNIILYSISLLLTIGMAALSYRFMEKRFLRISHRLKPELTVSAANQPTSL